MDRSQKIQIAFNASCLHPNAVGGWARYTVSLIEFLRKFHSDEINIHELWNEKNIVHSFWEQFSLRNLLRARSIALLHSPANGGIPLFQNGVPSILTVHDLFSEEDFEWRSAFLSLRAFKQAMRYKIDWWISLKRCRKIIAVSEFTKGQLLKIGIPEDKVSVILEGVSPTIKFRAEKFEDLNSMSYLIYVGTTAPRKRVERLVERFLETNLGLKLVIVGPSAVPQFAKHPLIVYRTGLNDEELSSLYSNALCFVTFSEKEGFGLPLVEAMACGTPVVFTGGGAIAEVVGKGGLQIQETDLAATLKDLVESPQKLANLKDHAFHQAKKFSWETCAKQTVELYKSVLIS